mmetsp:Transcript_119966/g.384154  ORF Transcript_119966/g.384154 Transcript_119966/m.384154 type:complete len:237 (-) Transcript_119966:76-786(-)
MKGKAERNSRMSTTTFCWTISCRPRSPPPRRVPRPPPPPAASAATCRWACAGSSRRTVTCRLARIKESTALPSCTTSCWNLYFSTDSLNTRRYALVVGRRPTPFCCLVSPSSDKSSPAARAAAITSGSPTSDTSETSLLTPGEAAATSAQNTSSARMASRQGSKRTTTWGRADLSCCSRIPSGPSAAMMSTLGWHTRPLGKTRSCNELCGDSSSRSLATASASRHNAAASGPRIRN